MLYTHSWGLFFGVGASSRSSPIWSRRATERRGCCATPRSPSAAPALLYLPWVPTLLYQAQHTAAPWAQHAALRRAGPDRADLLGGDRIAVALLLVGRLRPRDAARRARRAATRERAVGVVAARDRARHARARLAALADLAGVGPRYFAVVARRRCCCCARSGSRARGRSGWSRSCSCCVFWVNPTSTSTATRATCATSAPRSARSSSRATSCSSAQPEQVAARLVLHARRARYADTIGPVERPAPHGLGRRARPPRSGPSRQSAAAAAC